MNKIFSYCNQCYWFEIKHRTPTQCEACNRVRINGVKRGLFQQKNEGNRICENCDYGSNGTLRCSKKGYLCQEYRAWKPIITEEKQMSMNCSTCAYLNRLDMCGRCVLSLDASLPPWEKSNKWKPKQEQQMKEYKITKTATIRNVAQTTLDTNCKDAMIKFIEYITSAHKNGYFSDVDSRVDKSSRLFAHLTKSDKSTRWGIEHGFIEEEIKYKSYTIDYMSYNLNIKTKVEFNGYIDDEDEDTLFFKLDNGKAFNIDKDLITNIKPKTPF